VALLGARLAHERIRRRMEHFARGLSGAAARVDWFEPEGTDLPGHLYSLATMGDLASLYLAAARAVDPTPVASIDELKRALGSGGSAPPA
jgi:glucose/mannose-6-phosphate isomerase